MPPRALRAAVVGSTGYIGMECTALLARHPGVEIIRVTGHSGAGRLHNEVVPGSHVALRVEDTLAADSADVVFAALPHTLAAQHARAWLSAGAVVVDMSADFRLRDPSVYQRWYGAEHPEPSLCEEAVYGLVETQRDALRDAELIAVPGCYPTAVLIACAPPLHAGLIELDLIVDAKSGVSGAGRTPSRATHFGEVNESVSAYSPGGHRHKPEMEQQLRAAAGEEVRLTFVPHLVPMTRGILVTAYLHPCPGVTADDVRAAYDAFAATNPFVVMSASPPSSKSVSGTNFARLHLAEQDGVLVVTCVIDNLVKGAAGQAVQAMNVRFGYAETAGLERQPLWP